jgi:hypothetical protein
MCIPPVVAGKLWLSVSLHSMLGNGSVNTFPPQLLLSTLEKWLHQSSSVRLVDESVALPIVAK